MGLHSFEWEPDPDAERTPLCPGLGNNECGAPTEALRVVPERSNSYLNNIFLCTRKGCKAAWPYNGAQRR